MKSKLTLVLTLCVSFFTYSQVGIGTTSPHEGAILDLTATNKALLLPRVASTGAISSPVNGMMIYDISSNCVKSYENDSWTACLTSIDGGSGGSATSFGDGVLCDAGAFVDPISAGTNSSRAVSIGTAWIGDRAILLDAAGKKFYIQSVNSFFDLDVHNLYASSGLTPTSISQVFPVGNIFPNATGHWVEMKIFGQLFPTKTWKQHILYLSSANTSYTQTAYWALLLATDGELKAVHYQKGANVNSQTYSGITGRDGVGQSSIATTIAMDPSLFYKSTDIKAYSDVNTQTATNWTWVEPFLNEYFTSSSTDFVNAALAFNAADNLWYTWGSRDCVASQTSITTYPNILLRTNPTTITESMTPLPATVLNNLLTTLGTTVKMPTEQNSTIIVSRRSNDAVPFLNFITSDNKVVRYRLDTGSYTVLSLPVGVNPVSLDLRSETGAIAVIDNMIILGSDGKLYKTTTRPTAAGQTGDITEFANSAWASAGFPVVKQYVRGRFIDVDGVLGSLSSSFATTTLSYPVLKQTAAIKSILYPFLNGNHGNLFIDAAGNFGEYSTTTPYFNKNGYLSGKIANYLYNRTNSVLLESFQFYPSKCSSY